MRLKECIQNSLEIVELDLFKLEYCYVELRLFSSLSVLYFYKYAKKYVGLNEPCYNSLLIKNI